jgi:hypothetical protein
MSKFNTGTTRPAVSSPIVSEHVPSARTHEGGAGFAREAKGELFLLAVTNMVSEATFYESGQARDGRFENLVHQVAIDDPEWMGRFIPWLRSEANMRSASLVAACEAVKARLDVGSGVANDMGAQMAIGYQTRDFTGGGHNRKFIDAACQRADEPGEVLAYWTSHYGRKIPKPVKRGVADAVARLYNGKSLLKYDTDSHGFRFGDVIELVHPAPHPDKPWQGDVFKYALDRRHNPGPGPVPESNRTLTANLVMRTLPVEDRRAVLLQADGAERLADAGFTWEMLAGWLQGPMDAKAWEAIIPSMGVMALARNLRNFDQAGVSDAVAATAAARFADAEQVAKSRMFPFRWLSAYRAAPSLRWAYPLEQALGHSLANVPALGGRTLLMVDTSFSMNAGFSKDGTLMRWDAAALFAIALGQRCASADVVSFSSARMYYHDAPGAKTKPYPLLRGESLLKSLERWMSDGYFLGGGTDTAGALRASYTNHDRVVIVTDEQAAHDPVGVTASIPAHVPVYTLNLAGYQHGHAPSGGRNRHVFGGLNDASFKLIPLLESGRDGAWPWESA